MNLLRTTISCAVALLAALASVHAETAGPSSPTSCDREWERIKSLPPLAKSEFDAWQGMAEPKQIKGLRAADMYYYVARVPHVVGAEQLPTLQQRDEWLSLAAASGHMAAKAALMRLRYLGVIDFDGLTRGLAMRSPEKASATRAEFLAAARKAAEAGDPEFASVMMDTARDENAFLHCARADRLQATRYSGCDPQTVTHRAEARKWAEIAARGGNPVAKELMCKWHLMSSQGTSADLGFFASPRGEHALWCFAAFTSPCSTTRHVDVVESLLKNGARIEPQPEKASEIRALQSRPIGGHKQSAFVFPVTGP